ncbi:cell division topological specificity factor MinE [Pelistega europaea]|uniref:Cell division topological specificity factor n=1 Tax=Pelistega europaea TaxID=106147 RepID=A0A7Y4LA45_9BURK|nr:cell division topological specificity factor MinE [Pelistega europaea]NOL49819.1 cell division topological specificity factor MinE [Pelistega europaea]
MSFLKFLLGEKKKSNEVAKDRLKLILIRDRETTDGATPDFLPQLQRELIEVISKYIKINPDDIKVNLDKQDSLEVLEVKIEMSPEEMAAARVKSQQA